MTLFISQRSYQVKHSHVFVKSPLTSFGNNSENTFTLLSSWSYYMKLLRRSLKILEFKTLHVLPQYNTVAPSPEKTTASAIGDSERSFFGSIGTSSLNIASYTIVWSLFRINSFPIVLSCNFYLLQEIVWYDRTIQFYEGQKVTSLNSKSSMTAESGCGVRYPDILSLCLKQNLTTVRAAFAGAVSMDDI